jgi:hypothetical protein
MCQGNIYLHFNETHLTQLDLLNRRGYLTSEVYDTRARVVYSVEQRPRTNCFFVRMMNFSNPPLLPKGSERSLALEAFATHPATEPVVSHVSEALVP